MNSIVLSAQTLDIINDILTEITEYGSDRKVNFSVNLSKEGENLVFNVIYNETEKEVFKGLINQENYVEAVKNENEKQEEREKDK